MEDLFENDEETAKKARLKHLGYELEKTGDPLFDLWERQIARGETPDLDADEDERSARRDALIKDAARKHFEETGELIYRSTPQEDGGVSRGLPEDLDFSASDVAQLDVEGLLSQISPDAFDEFVNALGAIKRG